MRFSDLVCLFKKLGKALVEHQFLDYIIFIPPQFYICYTVYFCYMVLMLIEC